MRSASLRKERRCRSRSSRRRPPISSPGVPCLSSSGPTARGLLNRNALLVPLHPGPECVQVRVERTGELDVAGGPVLVLEVPLELEHVADVVRTGETEASEDLGRDVVVADFLAVYIGQRGGHVAPTHMLAGDPDRLADELVAALEDAKRDLADVLGRDARHLRVAQREGDG